MDPMKQQIFTFIAILSTGISFSQTLQTDNYIVYQENSNTAYFYSTGESSYLDYFLSEKAKIGENEYYIRIRIYSWGESDTSYYRHDELNFYHYYPNINEESVVLPKERLKKTTLACIQCGSTKTDNKEYKCGCGGTYYNLDQLK